MRTKYGIGIFIFTFILIYLSANSVYSNSKESENPEEIISTDGQVFDSSGYYLFEKNGFIVVYLNDKKTVYEYTNILYDELPPILQSEIRNGKYVKNLEELYGFLENYTS